MVQCEWMKEGKVMQGRRLGCLILIGQMQVITHNRGLFVFADQQTGCYLGPTVTRHSPAGKPGELEPEWGSCGF